MPPNGIRGTHDIPWGSHVCLFYRRPTEFLQVTAGFLQAGLAEHELCVWVLPPPLTIPLALQELSHHGFNGPSRRNHITQKIRIADQRTLYIFVHDDPSS